MYGVSPGSVAIILVLVTGLLPLGGVNLLGTMNSGMQPFLYSAFIVIVLDSGAIGLWSFLNPLFVLMTIWFTIPLSLFNILYVRQILRYFNGLSSQGSAVMAGLLSLIVPTILSFYLTQAGLPLGLIIPIPIQFLIGLVFLFKFREPEFIAPWVGIDIDWSWWKSEQRKGQDTTLVIPSFSHRLQDHEADWLEGW